MPIVAHNDLPTFDRLRAEGQNILDPARAFHQDIRELHIGLCNMMPDTALAATERHLGEHAETANGLLKDPNNPGFEVPEAAKV